MWGWTSTPTSPEQASGRAVDSRSDIFFPGHRLVRDGCGSKPFTGHSAIELLSAILKDEPPSLIELKPELPESLSRIVRRCLAKKPEERYQDAGELHRELSGVAGGSDPEEKAAPAEAPWIAVLPLKTRSGDGELDAFADGLSEDIITGLSRFSHLFVVSAGSASRYNGQAVDVREVGKELGARFVIEGSIRKAGPRVRVNVQLLDATSGTHLWAEHFDRDISGGDVFAAQDELTDRIVATVADTYGVLSRSLAALVKEKPVDELTAYESVLRMFGYWQQVTPQVHAEVRSALERALEREPNHADAWGCLSWAYVIEHKLGFNPRPDPLDRALSAARRGVELDATSQIAYSALAHAHYCRRELGAFRPAAERVLTLNPRETFHVALMGLLIATAGDWARGTSVMRETIAQSAPRWLVPPRLRVGSLQKARIRKGRRGGGAHQHARSLQSTGGPRGGQRPARSNRNGKKACEGSSRARSRLRKVGAR